jgi:hypothetical protein
MAICNALTTGLSKSCDTNAGGVNKIYIADYVSVSPTISGGEITALSPDLNQGIYVISTTATVNTTIAGPLRVIDNVTLLGNFTSILTPGKQFRFTYNTTTGGGGWTGPVLSSTYNSGTNVTTITPDFAGFTPGVGPAASPAPNNTSNQSITTWLFFEIQTNKNVCNFTEAVQVDMNNGTTFFNQVVNLVLSRRENTKRQFIEKLVDGQKQLLIVVLDSNGKYWLFGLYEGSYITAIEGGSGTAKADQAGYSVTFTSMEPEQAYEITANAIAPYLWM